MSPMYGLPLKLSHTRVVVGELSCGIDFGGSQLSHTRVAGPLQRPLTRHSSHDEWQRPLQAVVVVGHGPPGGVSGRRAHGGCQHAPERAGAVVGSVVAVLNESPTVWVVCCSRQTFATPLCTVVDVLGVVAASTLCVCV
jgi:hypothetical protein